MSARMRGFTLLEVLIAIAVLAIVLTGLVRAVGQQAEALSHERELTYATWVANDVLTRTRLGDGFPGIGRREGSDEQAGRRYRWELAVSGTDEPSIRRLDVSVYAPESDADDGALLTLTGFAGQR